MQMLLKSLTTKYYNDHQKKKATLSEEELEVLPLFKHKKRRLTSEQIPLFDKWVNTGKGRKHKNTQLTYSVGRRVKNYIHKYQDIKDETSVNE